MLTVPPEVRASLAQRLEVVKTRTCFGSNRACVCITFMTQHMFEIAVFCKQASHAALRETISQGGVAYTLPG
jgi:hypothetical protein